MPRSPALLFLIGVLIPTIAGAGTLCGTVTDRQTDAPVAHAGIFLRTPAGAYTGIYGATDVAGAFCISSVPAGTYDIEVRVDDYQVAYLRGVVVTESTTDVEVGASPAALRLAAPWPNPARTTTRLRWTLAAPARVSLAIHDLQGRWVRGWGATLPAGDHSVDWNLRDANGNSLAAGLYFVSLTTNGERRVRSVVLAH